MNGFWFGGVVGALVIIGTAPMIVGKIRYDEIDPCKLMEIEAGKTGTVILKEVLRDYPATDFTAAIFRVRDNMEDEAARIARDYANTISKQDGIPACYTTFYLDLIDPDRFESIFVQAARKTVKYALESN